MPDSPPSAVQASPTGRLSRLKVTALLAGTGAVIGFVLGSILLGVLQIWAPRGFHWRLDVPFAMSMGGTFGAAVGAVGTPIIAWTLLRTVPLGRAIGGTALATVTGATVGALAFGHPAIGGCIGFLLGGLVLRLSHRAPRG